MAVPSVIRRFCRPTRIQFVPTFLCALVLAVAIALVPILQDPIDHECADQTQYPKNYRFVATICEALCAPAATLGRTGHAIWLALTSHPRAQQSAACACWPTP